MSSNNNDMLKLKNKVEKLNKNQSIEIFKIVYKNGDKYTQNKNGIFLDINSLMEQSINEIRAFIEFTEDKGKHINEIEAKIKENIINVDNNNKFTDRSIVTINNEFQIIICSDYSPFITDLNDNFLDDKITRVDETITTNIINVEEDLNEIIDEECDENIDEDEDTISYSQNNQKKKKNAGIKYRILKKCKNLNNFGIDGNDDYDRDINDDIDTKELLIELEYI